MFGSAAAQASGCSSAPSGFYPHKQLQSTEYFPLELCLPPWPPIPTRLPTPLLPIFLLHPFPVATSPPCPTDGSRRWRPQPPHQRRTRRAGMLRCAALRELTPLHTCTHTRRGTASLITNVWGITLKNKCVLEWSRSCGSAHHISLMHNAHRECSIWITSTLCRHCKRTPRMYLTTGGPLAVLSPALK